MKDTKRMNSKGVNPRTVHVLVAGLFLLFTALPAAHANNINVEKADWISQDKANDTVTIEFDISWENSWKDSINNDAAWVFVKYTINTADTWDHAILGASGFNPATFSGGDKDGVDLIVPDDKIGLFIQRNAPGVGNLDADNIRILWDYGVDGISDANAAEGVVNLKIFAIEMVYVPEGGFQIGHNADGSTSGAFEYRISTSSQAGPINSEELLFFSSEPSTQSDEVSTYFYYNSGSETNETASGTPFNVPESFPKGFKAFYAMKYEVSQGQYRDFLNTLGQAEQTTRVAADLTNETDANTYVMVAEAQATVALRQTIKAGANPADGKPYSFTCDLDDDNIGDEPTDGSWIAMNYMSWMDLAAFLDWAGLRPMTELEFEKMCRGPSDPISGQYAWGNTTLTQAQGAMTNTGATNEVASNTGDGMANYEGAGTGIGGPARVGFLSTAIVADRDSAGASYYGIMELSGNAQDKAVTVGTSFGRGFSGSHGDGQLTAAGNATNPDWPGYAGNPGTGVNAAAGAGARGGSFITTTTTDLNISDRTVAASPDSGRNSDDGGRGIRTAPYIGEQNYYN